MKGVFIMIIDSAIQVFSEKYDREAIQSIEEISKERGLVLNRATIKAFNMNESFNTFSQYLKEYANYKVENQNNEKASPQDVIRESVDKFIKSQLFKESDILYSDLPDFVMGYVEGIQTLSEAVDEAKRTLSYADIDPEAIGDVNEFADRFMDALHESFDPTMDKILLASGYTSKKKLRSFKEKRKQPVFL